MSNVPTRRQATVALVLVGVGGLALAVAESLLALPGWVTPVVIVGWPPVTATLAFLTRESDPRWAAAALVATGVGALAAGVAGVVTVLAVGASGGTPAGGVWLVALTSATVLSVGTRLAGGIGTLRGRVVLLVATPVVAVVSVVAVVLVPTLLG